MSVKAIWAATYSTYFVQLRTSVAERHFFDADRIRIAFFTLMRIRIILMEIRIRIRLLIWMRIRYPMRICDHWSTHPPRAQLHFEPPNGSRLHCERPLPSVVQHYFEPPQILNLTLMWIRIRIRLLTFMRLNPDTGFNFGADPDPDFPLMWDPAFLNDADLRRSGFGSPTLLITETEKSTDR
jgi:hypothetical protein